MTTDELVDDEMCGCLYRLWYEREERLDCFDERKKIKICGRKEQEGLNR